MSVKSKFTGKSSVFKPIVIIIAILLIIGGIYSFFGKNNAEENNEIDGLLKSEIQPSGIDSDQEVEDVKDVEKVIAKWIEANPQAILNSVANMQKKMAEEQVKNAQKSIKSKKDDIFDKHAPSYKPRGYDVTIVEFYDYNCGYCKRANATIEQLIAKDKKVRVIYRDFPILGKASEELAKVSIAVDVAESSSFRKFHNALMQSQASTQEEALQVAKSVGINIKKVKKILSSRKDRIQQIIDNNRNLGSSIGIRGTPAFVIGDELIPGAISLQDLEDRIDEVR